MKPDTWKWLVVTRSGVPLSNLSMCNPDILRLQSISDQNWFRNKSSKYLEILFRSCSSHSWRLPGVRPRPPPSSSTASAAAVHRIEPGLSLKKHLLFYHFTITMKNVTCLCSQLPCQWARPRSPSCGCWGWRGHSTWESGAERAPQSGCDASVNSEQWTVNTLYIMGHLSGNCSAASV